MRPPVTGSAHTAGRPSAMTPLTRSWLPSGNQSMCGNGGANDESRRQLHGMALAALDGAQRETAAVHDRERLAVRRDVSRVHRVAGGIRGQLPLPSSRGSPAGARYQSRDVAIAATSTSTATRRAARAFERLGVAATATPDDAECNRLERRAHLARALVAFARLLRQAAPDHRPAAPPARAPAASPARRAGSTTPARSCVAPLNGSVPLAISCSSTPSAHRSLRSSAFPPRNTSGAR